MTKKIKEKSKIKEIEAVLEESKETKPLDVKQSEVEVPKGKQTLDLNESLACGYIAGLKTDGNFMFEIFGKDKTLTSLLGVHKIASKHIDMEEAKKFSSGDALVMQLANLVVDLNKKVDSLLATLAGPQNKL